MKILVIQKKFMGDVLVSSVVFRSLKEKFPDAELHYLISENYKQVVENHIFINKLVFFENHFKDTLKKIREEKYDAIIDSYSTVATTLLSFLSGAKKSMGFYKRYTQFFYTNPVKRKAATNHLMTTAIEHRLQILEPLGIKMKLSKPEIFITETERETGEKLLQGFGVNLNKKVVMISTFGSSSEKSYPHMREVLETISENSEAQILCNYLPSQKKDFQKLYSSLPEKTRKKIIFDFDTKNLREFISVLPFCNALIGNEGGSTNISKALDVPTFSIFAPFIRKESWNWFEDGERNTSVHISDFPKVPQNYESFLPELFENQLVEFVKNHL